MKKNKCLSHENANTDRDLAASFKIAVNTFAFDLLKVLNSSQGENIFFSPLSIFSCMIMAAAGAKGDTLIEMLTTLRCDKAVGIRKYHSLFKTLMTKYAEFGKEYDFVIANRLFVSKSKNATLTLLPEFKDTLTSFYSASIVGADFKTRDNAVKDEVNSWVNKLTRGKIKELLSEPPDESTALLILNAIYFLGSWADEFDPKKTKERVFYQNGNKDMGVKVPFMHNKVEGSTARFTKIGGHKVQVLDLPYKENKVFMRIILPKEIDGLESLLNVMKSVENTWIDAWQAYKDAIVYLPKWKFETSYKLIDAFSTLGMKRCFSGQADFSGINGSGGLEISNVIHKAVIEVDEVGTVAAAVTEGGFTPNCGFLIPPKEVEIIVDRPFLFYLFDSKARVILFLGIVRTIEPKGAV